MYRVTINNHDPILLDLKSLLRLIRFTDRHADLDAVSSLEPGESITDAYYSVVRIS